MADPNDSIAYLRSLVERMPENKDLPKPQFFMDPRSLSMANILKGGATNTLNWFDAVRGSGQEAKPGEGYGLAATGLTPEDVVVPTGIGAMGLKALALRETLDRPSLTDSARAKYLEWKHPDDFPAVTGGTGADSAAGMLRTDRDTPVNPYAIKDASFPGGAYDGQHVIANERGTPRDRFRLLAENDSTAGNIINSLPMDEASRLNRASGLDLVRRKRDLDEHYPNTFIYDIHRDGRKTDGTLIGNVNGDTADIKWMGGGAPNELGISGLKQLREAFRRDYPNVKHFTGDRVSGARSNGDEAVKQSVTLLSDQSRASVPGTVVNAQEERSPTLAELLMRGSY